MKKLGSLFSILVFIFLFSITASADKGASYVTSDTECNIPLNLEDNLIAGSEVVNVWLKLNGTSLGELCWALHDKGKQESSGTFSFICSSGDLVLASTGISTNDSGSHTLKVTYCSTGDTFGNDSFRFD